MAIPAVTCGAGFSYNWSSGDHVTALSASATNGPIVAWQWNILAVPVGLESLLTGVHGDFTDGVATVQNPSITIPSDVAAGTILFQCIAVNADGPSLPTTDKRGAQQRVTVKTQLLALSLPADATYDWGQGQLDAVLRSLEAACSGGTGGGWKTALNINFITEPTQSLGADLTYSIGGFPFAKINSANDDVPMVLTNGQGIVVTPKAATDYWNAVRTLPALVLRLSDAISGFHHGTPIRVMLYLASYNGAANFDGAGFGVERLAANTHYQYRKVYNTAVKLAAVRTIDSVSTEATNTTYAAHNVLCLEYPSGVGSYLAVASSGTWAAGFPALDSLRAIATYGPPSTGVVDVSRNGLPTDWNLLLGAMRAGSGTAFVAKLGALRIDYK